MHVTDQAEEEEKKPAAYSHKVATQFELHEKWAQGFHQTTNSPEAHWPPVDWTLNIKHGGVVCIVPIYISFQSMKDSSYSC